MYKVELRLKEHRIGIVGTQQNFESGYAAVNGLNMYYEIHGAGEPLILLHGGVGASAMFRPVLPTLAAHRQVITVDLQAHVRQTASGHQAIAEVAVMYPTYGSRHIAAQLRRPPFGLSRLR